MEHQSTQQQRDDARLARRMHLHAARLGSKQAWAMIERTFLVASHGAASETLTLFVNTQEPGSGFYTEVRRLQDPTARSMTAQMIEDDFRHAVTQFLSKHQPAPTT